MNTVEEIKRLRQQLNFIEIRLTNIRQTAGGEVGEINTASNIGAGGVGPYAQKVGVDLQFRNIIKGASDTMIVALDAPNNEIELDVNPAKILLNDLGNVIAPAPAGNDVLQWNGFNWVNAVIAAGGDVVGPAGATDNAIARYHLATGKIIQNSVVLINDNGMMMMNETSNIRMTRGLTINQISSDDEILAFKSSTDVAHGITLQAETDTYGFFKKRHASYGGLVMMGLSETSASGTPSVDLIGITADASSLTSFLVTQEAIVMVSGYNAVGTNVGNADAGMNTFGVRTKNASGSVYMTFAVNERGEAWSQNKIYINENACVNSTIGLIINQGTENDNIITLKSTSVTHGVTTLAETDTYLKMGKISGADGGLNFQAFTQGAFGFAFSAIVTTVTTTKTNASPGGILIDCFMKSGTGIGNITANANHTAFRTFIGGAYRTLAILDVEGELHLDSTVSEDAWDDRDDIQMASDYSRVIQGKFNEIVKYNIDDLQDAGLLTYSGERDNPSSIMLKTKAGIRFLLCTFYQMNERLKRLESGGKYLEN